ncbi:uncharacterized protein LOC108951010 isoform X2 [Ciona intestinalis]
MMDVNGNQSDVSATGRNEEATTNLSNWQNGTESEIEDIPGEWMVLLGLVVGVFIVVLGLFGNGVTIAAYHRNRKLQTSFNHLITNLCAIDLTFSVVALPLILPLISAHRDIYPREVCTFVAFIYYSLMSSSVINLVCIAINRYIGIVHSSRYRVLFAKDMIKWWLLGIWLSAPALYLPFVLTDTFVWRSSSYRCALSTSHFGSKVLKLYQIVINVVLQFVPTVALIGLYRAILCKVKKCRRTVEKYPAPVSASPSCVEKDENNRSAMRRRSSMTHAPVYGSHSQICSSPVEQNNAICMNYLQVPLSQQGSLSGRRNSLNFDRGGRRLSSPTSKVPIVTQSSPDLLSDDDSKHSMGSIRSETESIRRKSWGDEPHSTQEENFSYSSEARRLSFRSSRGITILSTIESEPNSKSEPTDDVTLEIARDVMKRKTSRQGSSEKDGSKTSESSIKEVTYENMDEFDKNTEVNLSQLIPKLKLACSSNQVRRQPSIIQESPEEEEREEQEERAEKKRLVRQVSVMKKECNDSECDVSTSIDVRCIETTLEAPEEDEPVKSDILSLETRRDNNREETEDKIPEEERKNDELDEKCETCTLKGNIAIGNNITSPQKRTTSIKRIVIPVSKRIATRTRSNAERNKNSRAEFQNRRAKSDTWLNPRQSWKRYCSQHKVKQDIEIVIEHVTTDDANPQYCSEPNHNTASPKGKDEVDVSDAVKKQDCCKCLLNKILRNGKRRKSNDADEQFVETNISPKNVKGKDNFSVTPEPTKRDSNNTQKVDATDFLKVEIPTSPTGGYKSGFPRLAEGEVVPETSDVFTEDRFSSVHSRLYRYSYAAEESCLSRQGSFSSCVQGHTTRRMGLERVASRELVNGSSGKDNGKGRGLHRNRTLYFSRKKSLLSSIHSNCSNESRRRRRRRDAERHLAYSGLVICLGFAVCVLPTSIIGVIQSSFGIRVSATIKFGVAVLSWIHCILNPLLYGFLNPQYRVEFRRMFRDVTCRGRKRHVARSLISVNKSSKSWHPASWWERRSSRQSDIL